MNNITTLQRSLQRTLQSTEDELAAQARITRELQDDLLRTRMIEFDSMADRLYRVVRPSAKEIGKRATLDLRGGRIEMDRSVLEQMVAPLEHLARDRGTAFGRRRCTVHRHRTEPGPEARGPATRPATRRLSRTTTTPAP